MTGCRGGSAQQGRKEGARWAKRRADAGITTDADIREPSNEHGQATAMRHAQDKYLDECCPGRTQAESTRGGDGWLLWLDWIRLGIGLEAELDTVSIGVEAGLDVESQGCGVGVGTAGMADGGVA